MKEFIYLKPVTVKKGKLVAIETLYIWYRLQIKLLENICYSWHKDNGQYIKVDIVVRSCI